MPDQPSENPTEQEIIHMVEERTGEEIALGISANVRKPEPADLREGVSAKLDQKAMTGKGTPQASAAPPPKPSDSATSAKPPPKES
jgi:hypothetical protein